MKKAKKVVALLLCAVLLVVGSVSATMAYLNDTSEVVNNTFTIGKVELKLDEAKVDLYGVKDENAARVTTNDYKLIPNHTYVKDPTVTILKNSEESYVRMVVTITDLKDLKAACGVADNADFLPQNFVEGWDNNVWKSTNVILYSDDKDTATYEFRYHKTVNTLDKEDKKLEALFTKFKMPGTATNEQIAALEEMEINVVAHAIQADGFTATEGKTAEQNAWEAFGAVTAVEAPENTPETPENGN
jgi:predicted ribosomally synthesized peptide with SipW-like signal peptide